MSLPNLEPTAPSDLDQTAAIILRDIYEATQWACLRYWGRIRQDELDDLSQQIVLKLIGDDCRLLHSFKCQSAFKTWLQAVVNNHVCNYFHRGKQAERPDEVGQEMLTYSPSQDQEIYTAEKQKLLVRALSKLNERERLLYYLWFVVELDPIKIAAIFGTRVRIIYKRKQTLVLKLTRLVHHFQIPSKKIFRQLR